MADDINIREGAFSSHTSPIAISSWSPMLGTPRHKAIYALSINTVTTFFPSFESKSVTSILRGLGITGKHLKSCLNESISFPLRYILP